MFMTKQLMNHGLLIKGANKILQSRLNLLNIIGLGVSACWVRDGHLPTAGIGQMMGSRNVCTRTGSGPAEDECVI